MMVEKDNDFKVIDKRSSAQKSDEESRDQTKADENAKGEGFTMSDASKGPATFQIDFSTLILSFATQALMHLGLAPDPTTKQTAKNPELAKHNIDILEVLAEKTKGNLSQEESRLLENLLTETRIRYVETTK